jgi:hypothetical protein
MAVMSMEPPALFAAFFLESLFGAAPELRFIVRTV